MPTSFHKSLTILFIYIALKNRGRLPPPFPSFNRSLTINKGKSFFHIALATILVFLLSSSSRNYAVESHYHTILTTPFKYITSRIGHGLSLLLKTLFYPRAGKEEVRHTLILYNLRWNGCYFYKRFQKTLRKCDIAHYFYTVDTLRYVIF